MNHFFDDLNLKSAKHLKMADLIDEMYFVVTPLMKRDSETMKILMEQSHLWNIDLYWQIVTLMKQSKWTEGIVNILNSKTAIELFIGQSL